MRRLLVWVLVALALLVVVAYSQPLWPSMRDQADEVCADAQADAGTGNYEADWKLTPGPHWQCVDTEGNADTVYIGWWP